MSLLYSKDSQGVSPLLYDAHIDDTPPGSHFGPYDNAVYIVEYNTEGYGTFSINGRTFPVRPGDCYVLLPGQRCMHTSEQEEPRRGVYCRFFAPRSVQILREAGIDENNPYVPRDIAGDVFAVIMKMVAIRGDQSLGAELMRTACIYELLGTLLKNKSAADTNLLLDRALGIFETEYHLPLSVADVAAEVGFERSYFSTAFKKRTGTTPHAYLTSVRVRHAAKLLAEGGYSVSEIAEAVGLSPINFSRIFSRVLNLTPLEYAKRVRDIEEYPRVENPSTARILNSEKK